MIPLQANLTAYYVAHHVLYCQSNQEMETTGNGWRRGRRRRIRKKMAAALLPCTFYLPKQSSHVFSTPRNRLLLFRCSAKKKIGFFDQILDYIEGGPKLRRWYGAPELLPKDGSASEQDDEDGQLSENEVRDAILVADGDSELGQMVILQLIVKRARVKALVKDKRAAMEAFGTYVESIVGDVKSEPFLKKALRGVGTIISPNEGFFARFGSFKGIKHIVLLSQLSVYRSSSGIQSLMNSNARKLGELDESAVMSSGVPYTIVRTGALQNTSGGTQGFSFVKARFCIGCAEKGTLSKEDAAFICVEALEVVPQGGGGFIFEVINGGEKVSNWKECLTRLMEQEPKQA
ncbi:Sanguinarine reductase [Linum perenne]